ncbi:unnamed protein product [Fraxinus pennsylvanica]|uniref:Uncharacterized protein n=1 Tax=Fraxinus pennsylvanica TaxID=56036 RepID=A0AAD2A1I0_9LAMI|nr:unnamed protein product [Fraxinus pennsylvanica]
MTTPAPKGDDQNAEITQICIKSQESSSYITKDEWLISIEKYDENTTKKPKIQKVPSMLRELNSNTNSYDPLVVSIGPYHHGTQKLEAFEKLKISIAQKFCLACGNKISIKDLYEEVAKVGKSARECYEEGSTKCFDDEVFNRMMFLDACFVLHFMFILQEGNVSNGTDKEQKEVDPLQDGSCYLAFVQRDLFLLENQIPLLVLNVLMKFRFQSESQETELIQNFLDRKATIMPLQENTCTNVVKKFVQKMMGLSDQKTKWKLDLNTSPPHLLHLAREQLIGPPPEETNMKKSVQWHSYPCEISAHDPSELRIALYICLMDSLVDNVEDVKQLLEKGI